MFIFLYGSFHTDLINECWLTKITLFLSIKKKILKAMSEAGGKASPWYEGMALDVIGRLFHWGFKSHTEAYVGLSREGC